MGFRKGLRNFSTEFLGIFRRNFSAEFLSVLLLKMKRNSAGNSVKNSAGNSVGTFRGTFHFWPEFLPEFLPVENSAGNSVETFRGLLPEFLRPVPPGSSETRKIIHYDFSEPKGS